MSLIPLFQSPKSFYRLAVASFFFLQGLVFASWASRIPDIKQALDLNEAQLGGVLFAIPVGQMSAMALSGYLVSRLQSDNYEVAETTLTLVLASFREIAYS